MKAGIITFHFVNNFGGALQAYALRRVVEEKCEVEAEIIDYRHWFILMTDFIRLFPVGKDYRIFFPGAQTFFKRILRLKKFRQFMEDNAKLSPVCYTSANLKKKCSGYDLYICGSDQIWNPILTFGVSSPYYLAFAPDESRRISYAVSVGEKKLPFFVTKKMRQLLKRLHSISVREESQFLLNLCKRNLHRNIDPVFLLSKEEWSDVARLPEEVKNAEEKYILVYFMQMDNEAYQYVDRIKQETGYRVYDISRYGFNPGCLDETIIGIGPDEFVGMFLNADVVCTNSFHGLVYGLLFQKKTFFVSPKRFGYRIEYLSHVLQFELKPREDAGFFEVVYDEEDLEKKIQKERGRTISYLKRNISITKNGDDE